MFDDKVHEGPPPHVVNSLLISSNRGRSSVVSTLIEVIGVNEYTNASTNIPKK